MLYPQTGPTLRAVGVFLQTSCFGPDRHLATCKAPLGSFQLTASWCKAPTEVLARTYSACGEQDLGSETSALPGLHLLLSCREWRVSLWGDKKQTKNPPKTKNSHLSNLESRIQKHKAKPHLSHPLGIWKL